MLRKTVFWIHLGCGIAAGLVVLMMSVTGVILTYERELLAWAERGVLSGMRQTAGRLSVDALVAAMETHEPGFEPATITIAADARTPATLGAGRSGSRLVDPYSGASLGEGATGMRRFFGTVEGWHRWFNAGNEDRALWRAVTGASNLAFLFLIVSGLYLWLPRVYRWAAFQAHLLFNPKAKSGKARDYNWHHVFGIWSALPLLVVVATAVVFSYPWANDLVYAAFGEAPPQRSAQPGPPPAGNASVPDEGLQVAPARPPLEALFRVAAQHVAGWQSITMQIPEPAQATVRFTIDRGDGGEPQRRDVLVLDAVSGTVTAWEPFAGQSPGRRARSWIRFLHTGEAFGLAGQTVAGLVSLTSGIMVWTGLALAYRRLIVPMLRRKRRG
jgi:uncharacterized iron-regulated membrane protein